MNNIVAQTAYGKAFLENLYKYTIVVPLVNRDYEGLPTAGIVKVPTVTKLSANDYVSGTGVSASTTDVTYIDVLINKQKAIWAPIDNYSAATVPASLIANRLDEMAKAFAVDYDTAVIADMTTNGTISSNTIASTKSTIYTNIVAARTALSNASVPQTERSLLVSPETYALLLTSDEFIKASDLGQNYVATGALGQVAGMPVYESNNLPANTEFVAFHKSGITMVDAFKVEPEVKDAVAPRIGESDVVGRTVYGTKVLDALRIYVKNKA